jgi:sigma-E factor negative regulatory protein RseC
MRNELITHEGIVKQVEGTSVRVTILQSSACSGCAAKAMCSSAEAKEKEVDIITADAHLYGVGQKVMLEGRLADGRLAAMIAYGLPLLLMLPVLFVAIRLSGSEAQGAIWSLLAVALYYLCIYFFFRERLQSRFSFRIASKLTDEPSTAN